jgi:hypothetical protein
MLGEYSMKFYGFIFDKNAKKHFVTKFEVVNDEIIQYMANGEIRKKPYSKKGESKLLKRMQEQVKKEKTIIGPNIFSFAWLGAFLLGTISESILVSIIESIMFLTFGVEIISNFIKVKDLQKNRFFLWNSKTLNSDRVVKDDNVLLGVSKKTQEIIRTTPSEKPIFTINSIDGMSLQDLKKIRANIHQSYCTFLSNYDDDKEELGKQYIRKASN